MPLPFNKKTNKKKFQIDSTVVKQWMRRNRKLFLPGLRSHTGD